MTSDSNLAVDLFFKGYNCAQAVLWAFREESGLPEETALKIACGLGAGMGRRQEVCGAVTGGILVLGLRHGRGLNDPGAAMEVTYSKTRELMALFEKEYGSCICRQLLHGCDLTTDEGQRTFNENEYLTGICKKCVQTVIGILEHIK